MRSFAREFPYSVLTSDKTYSKGRFFQIISHLFFILHGLVDISPKNSGIVSLVVRPWEKLKNLESWELAGLWIIYWDRTPYIISPDLYNSSCRAKADSNNCQLNTIFSLSSLSLIRKLTKSLLEYSWSRVLPNVFALRDYTLGTTPQFCFFLPEV